MNINVRSFIFVLVTLAAPTSIAQDLSASCAVNLAFAGPDLATIEVTLGHEAEVSLNKVGLTTDRFVNALRAAPREPLDIPGTGLPKFLVFVPYEVEFTGTLRVEFFWNAERKTALIKFVRKFNPTIDRTLSFQTKDTRALRGHPVRFAMNDAAMASANQRHITVETVAEVLADPELAEVVDETRPGQIWLLGRSPAGRPMSLKAVRHSSIIQIRDVVWAQPSAVRGFEARLRRRN